jgi:hypothetical protein
MKGFLKKPAGPEPVRHPQNKPKEESCYRLSKVLPGGGKEPPGDRGNCEKQTTTQGSE